MTPSPGIHHVTAITGDAARNLAFYEGTLGLRLVKRTVNFDDPGTWHLYYGDALGTPGTILTFFPWAHAARGRPGAGQAAETSFAVRPGALTWWRERLRAANVAAQPSLERFGETALAFQDGDGQLIEIVGRENATNEDALGGFGGVTLQVADPAPTAAVLADAFGWTRLGEENGVVRFTSPDGGQHVDLVPGDGDTKASMGRGSVHHIAFRAADDAHQAALAEAVAALGIGVTEQKDRQYFRSVYFREPGGVIFEIATDEPGFAVDEPPDALGRTLKLPAWLEPRRSEIEARLPPLVHHAA